MPVTAGTIAAAVNATHKVRDNQGRDVGEVLTMQCREGLDRKDLDGCKILCGQTADRGYLFAVAQLKDGRIVVVTAGHATAYVTLDELRAANVLNRHEALLLDHGINK